ncbi:MAG: hypothetical protein MJZ33_09330 [Paludibacteraceae bacterium]|nr:hypothetical protein [Paludibacteraceae bacterium]
MGKYCNLSIIALIGFAAIMLTSCASSSSVTRSTSGPDISEYKYVIFGSLNDDGDGELTDIILMVDNVIAEKLQVVSKEKALSLYTQGEKIITPTVSVKSEKWEGGYTYITITFKDFETNQLVAVVKSSGIGMSIAHDQKLALEAIKKELDKTFK